jgi:hypothetical protein
MSSRQALKRGLTSIHVGGREGDMFVRETGGARDFSGNLFTRFRRLFTCEDDDYRFVGGFGSRLIANQQACDIDNVPGSGNESGSRQYDATRSRRRNNHAHTSRRCGTDSE